MTLFASPVSTFDLTVDSNIGQVTGIAVDLAPGESKVLKIPYAYPTQVSQGSYTVEAEVVSTIQDNNVTNNFSAPVGPVPVGAPILDLSLGFAAQPPVFTDPGQVTPLSMIVTNSGNKTSTGDITFRVYVAKANFLEPTDVVVQRFKFTHAHIKPGKSKIFNLVVNNPGPNLGMRYIIVAVDSNDPLAKTNPTANLVVSPVTTDFR